jgi:hypothetical protein
MRFKERAMKPSGLKALGAMCGAVGLTAKDR